MTASSNGTESSPSSQTPSTQPWVKICLYLQETPESQPFPTYIQLSRAPMMGEFIAIGGILYRVFLVCHQADFKDIHASVGAVKTPWESCEQIVKVEPI
ncbi:hypothetical protein [Roseofilum casamattae]|uniref:Uncharacterized protein n=1 Tax=Roseofilum casamattae BLCC-M143 TaxID=3022442 RepID=A0ABT7C153_9CYAN|nr:hypothetical protein [Roseofilum casamattae]MDJ1184474.1 hypothetical protein [Roseofilum casamattae BLCC-M143]